MSEEDKIRGALNAPPPGAGELYQIELDDLLEQDGSFSIGGIFSNDPTIDALMQQLVSQLQPTDQPAASPRELAAVAFYIWGERLPEAAALWSAGDLPGVQASVLPENEAPSLTSLADWLDITDKGNARTYLERAAAKFGTVPAGLRGLALKGLKTARGRATNVVDLTAHRDTTANDAIGKADRALRKHAGKLRQMQERVERAKLKMNELPIEELFAYSVLYATLYAAAPLGGQAPDVLGHLLEQLAATQGKYLPDYRPIELEARENPVRTALAILEWLGIPNAEDVLLRAIEKMENAA